MSGAASLGSLFFYGYRAKEAGFAFFARDIVAFWSSYCLKVSRPGPDLPFRKFSLNLFFCGSLEDFPPYYISLLVCCVAARA